MKQTLSIVTVILLTAAATLIGQPQLDKARGLIKEKQFEEATKLCQSYLENNGRDEKGWLLLAQAYQQDGKLDLAEQAAKKTVQLDDELMEGHTVLAHVQFLKKNLPEAYASAKAGLKMTKKKQPRYPPLLIELGWILLASDSADAAQVAASEAKEIDPANLAAYEILGDAYRKQNVAPMAISSYERLLEIDSTQTGVLYKLANTYIKERQYTDAARVYSRILALDTNNDTARLELARLFFRAKQWTKCAATLKEYFKKEKKPAKDIQSMYLESLYNSKQYTEAAEAAKSYLQIEPNSALAYRSIAFGRMIEKKYIQAVDAFLKLATIDTMQFEDYRWLGNAYKQSKKDSLAAVTYEEALKDSTQSVTLRSYLMGEVGSIWMKYKYWERAAKNFESRILIDTAAVGASINLALCLIQMEQYEKAISVLRNAIAQNPKYPPAYVNLGFCFFQMKDYDSGRKEFEAAVKVIDTAEVKYKLELADSYRMIAIAMMMEKKTTVEESKKKWDDALVLLKKSLKYKEDLAQTHLLMGQCNQNLNKIDEAIKEYKRTLVLDPNNKEAKKYLDDLLKLQP